MSIFQTIAEAQREAPVDVEALCRRIGIPVRYQWMPSGVSGALVRKGGDAFEIQINSMDPPTRQRFTIAHELGHYVHHRSLIGEGVNDSTAYRVTPNAAHYNPRIGPRQETEANQFAASLLMPSQEVARLKTLGYSVKDIARHLGVSEHAMSIRLGVPYQG